MIMASIKNDLSIIKQEVKFISHLIRHISEVQHSVNVILTTPEATGA